MSFDNQGLEEVSCLFEEGGLDFGALGVLKVHVHEVALPTLVLPLTFLVLFNYLDFEDPVSTGFGCEGSNRGKSLRVHDVLLLSIPLEIEPMCGGLISL